MSSMRNAVQRRNHRERGQPQERQRLGLLEKHKVSHMLVTRAKSHLFNSLNRITLLVPKISKSK